MIKRLRLSYNKIIFCSTFVIVGIAFFSCMLLSYSQLGYSQVGFKTEELNSQSDSNSALADSTTTETTNEPIILDSVVITNSAGSRIMGEVQNNFTFPIEFVQVSATVYDSNGVVQSTGFGYSDLEQLRPREKSGFTILLEDKIPKDTKYSLSVNYNEASEEKPAYLKLNAGKQSKDSLGRFRVVGEILNRGPDTATFVRVNGVFYDRDHKVVESAFTYTNPENIKSGKKAPFDLTTSGNAEKIKSVSLNTESNQYAMIRQTGNGSSNDG